MIFGGQGAPLGRADIGRIADDQVEAAVTQGGIQVRLHGPDPVRHVMTLDIDAGHGQGIVGNIDCVDLRVRERQCAGNGNAGAAGAKIQNAGHGLRIQPGFEPLFDQFGDRRARHQYPFVHMEGQAGKQRFTRQIGQRLALGHPLFDQIQHPATLGGCQVGLEISAGQVVGQMQGMQHQGGRLVERAGGTMTEEHPAFGKATGSIAHIVAERDQVGECFLAAHGLRDRGRYRQGRSARRAGTSGSCTGWPARPRP